MLLVGASETKKYNNPAPRDCIGKSSGRRTPPHRSSLVPPCQRDESLRLQVNITVSWPSARLGPGLPAAANSPPPHLAWVGPFLSHFHHPHPSQLSQSQCRAFKIQLKSYLLCPFQSIWKQLLPRVNLCKKLLSNWQNLWGIVIKQFGFQIGTKLMPSSLNW